MSGIVAARGPFDPRLGRRMMASFGDGTGVSTVPADHFSGTIRPGDPEWERAAVGRVAEA
jgi:hypothetical protein